MLLPHFCRAASLWLALLAVLCLPGIADAQTCHSLNDPRKDAEYPFRAVSGVLVAGYERAGERGDYEGLYAGFGYRQPWFGADVLLPAYRLARAHQTELGLGDLLVTARGTALRAYDGKIAFGVELPAMLPTGRESASLGMGHVMLMPALWFALALEPFSLQARAGYGRVLGQMQMEMDADVHAAHAHQTKGQTPIVNPMNHSEFEHALDLGLAVQKHVSLHARWFGAVPVGDAGVTRQILGAGATLGFDQADFTLELQRPFAGNPFELKGAMQLVGRF